MRERRTSPDEKGMRAVLIGGALIFVIGGWFILRAFWKPTPVKLPADTSFSEEKAEEDIPLITVETVRQKISNNERVTLIDIREEESYKALHIPHSLHLSSGALGSFVPEEGETVVVVLSWNNTQMREVAKNVLRQKSSPAFFLKGGFEAWQQSGNQTIALGDPNSFLDQSKITYIIPTEALKMINDPSIKPFILDVQSPQNYLKVHIKGAINIPLGELEKRFKEIPAAKNILVYGESEVTSFQGGVRLADLNFFGTRTLQGSTVLRPESGLPLEP